VRGGGERTGVGREEWAGRSRKGGVGREERRGKKGMRGGEEKEAVSTVHKYAQCIEYIQH
jgi:hypothetical protein